MKRLIFTCGILVATVLFSGCSATPGNTSVSGTSSVNFLKSGDGGVTWNPKVKVDEKKTISSADVLSIAIHPNDSQTIYLGTVKSGILKTKNGAETWEVLAFAEKVYGLTFDRSNPDIMYSAGVYKNRGKIFKRESEQGEWKEIYTEPSDGTYVTALGIDKNNGKIIYAGTSSGVIIKSVDGGISWKNIKKADGSVVTIAFDSGNTQHIYFGIFQKGILETKNGAETLEDITQKFGGSIGGISNNVYTVVADPQNSGVVYVGTDQGIILGSQKEDKWDSLNIIASSQKFPIRAIAINPNNSKELIYSASGVVYRTIDGGTQWSTYQLDMKKGVGVLQYSPSDPSDVFMGLRNL
jgi:photosystem II stability/assembly factor-like uncharacterized protein